MHMDTSRMRQKIFFFFMGASIQSESVSVRVWEDVHVPRLWSGSMLGCIPHGRRICSWRNHGYAAHIQYTWTHSWRQSETEERQYSMRQASGLQSTIPASSYLVGGILGTRPNQTRQVRSVKGHGAFDSAHVLSSLWFCFFFSSLKYYGHQRWH